MAVMELRAFHLPQPLECKLGEERLLQADIPGPSLVEAALTSICSPHLHVHQVCLFIQSGHGPGEGRETEAQCRQDRTADNTWEAHRVIIRWENHCLKQRLSYTMGTHRVRPLVGPGSLLPLVVAVTCNGHNT